jgi:hypothetical protein
MGQHIRYPAVVTSGAQTIAGAKTFSSGVTVAADLVVNGYVKPFGSGIVGGGSALVIQSQTSDVAASTNVVIDAANALSVAGTKLLSLKNATVEKAYWDAQGNPSPPLKRLGGWGFSGYGATSYTAIGLAAFTQVGTAYSGSVDWPDHNVMLFETAATINSVAGITGGYSATRMGWQPRLTFSFVSVYGFASSRWYLGLSTSDLSGYASLAATNAAKYICLRVDTGIGDTTFKIASSDGTTASETNTGITVANNVMYQVSIDCFNTGTAIVTINGSRFLKTTNLPPSGTNLGVQATTTTLSAAMAHIHTGSFALEQNL